MLSGRITGRVDMPIRMEVDPLVVDREGRSLNGHAALLSSPLAAELLVKGPVRPLAGLRTVLGDMTLATSAQGFGLLAAVGAVSCWLQRRLEWQGLRLSRLLAVGVGHFRQQGSSDGLRMHCAPKKVTKKWKTD